MVRAIEQIEQEIAALDQSVNAIAQAFYDAYRQYLTALGQATQQQLISAGYHICTRSYSEQFLELSLSQRQDLQQSLRRLAKQAETDLLACLKPIKPTETSHSRTDSRLDDEDAAMLADNEESLAFEAALELAESADAAELATSFLLSPQDLDSQESSDTPTNPDAQENLDSQEGSASQESSDMQTNEALNSAMVVSQDAESRPNVPAEMPAEAPDRPLHPKDIVRWQAKLEDSILELLQNLSHKTNRLLQQANILPSRLPEPVLEVAAKADLASETTASPPNLLNLLIETEEDEEKPSMTQVVAVRLRLSEIEFGNAAAAAHRSKLRQLMAQLSKLGREYQRKQKERSVAQAEAAWRSSWYEGED